MPMYTDDVVRSQLTMKVDSSIDNARSVAMRERRSQSNHYDWVRRQTIRAKVKLLAKRLRSSYELDADTLRYVGRAESEFYKSESLGREFIGSIGIDGPAPLGLIDDVKSEVIEGAFFEVFDDGDLVLLIAKEW